MYENGGINKNATLPSNVAKFLNQHDKKHVIDLYSSFVNITQNIDMNSA